jgi:ribosomal protein S1
MAKASSKTKLKVSPEETSPPEEITTTETAPAVTADTVITPETPAAPAAPAPAKATPKTLDKSGPAPKNMADLLAGAQSFFRTPKKGETVVAKVSDKTRRSLLLDIGGKTEGLVVDKEFDAARDYIEQLEPGDEVEAFVIATENDRGQILLSLKKAATDTKWDELTKAMNEGTVMEVKGLEVNKGGLIVSLDGIRGFIPTSQFGRDLVPNIAKMKGKKLQAKVIEVDREKNRLIFSEKHVSEASEIAERLTALKMVKTGDTLDGVISGITHFGIFITVSVKTAEKESHIEGLVHISEISWEKVSDPHDFHKIGEKVQVKVLGIDEDAGKLNLSLKQLTPDPWDNIAEKYPVGTTITGKVSRVATFGVFVKLEPGVDGLIHTSKLTPDQTYDVGEDVTVVVESVDPDQRRMSLSVVLTEVPMGYK